MLVQWRGASCMLYEINPADLDCLPLWLVTDKVLHGNNCVCGISQEYAVCNSVVSCSQRSPCEWLILKNRLWKRLKSRRRTVAQPWLIHQRPSSSSTQPDSVLTATSKTTSVLSDGPSAITCRQKYDELEGQRWGHCKLNCSECVRWATSLDKSCIGPLPGIFCCRIYHAAQFQHKRCNPLSK